jgi:hypothetical protein
MTDAVDIRAARSAEDLERVYRFRYRIYVEEMRRKQKYADHALRRIEDPLDVGAINLAAFRENEVVGTVRINFSRTSDIGYYGDFYAMTSVGDDHPAHTSINTRLMIAPEFRKSRLALKMAIASYEFGAPKGIKWNFVDCNDHLVAFFKGLGYIEHVPKAEHEEYGLVTRLRLDVLNVVHLGLVNSPFVPYAKRLLSEITRPPELLSYGHG